MAEVATLYAAETALEGLAVSAFAVSKSTAPLTVRFHKLKDPSPNSELARSSHTLNVVKAKAYIYGGDLRSGVSDPYVHVVTLPSGGQTGEGELHYQRVEPKVKERALEGYATVEETGEPNETENGKAGENQNLIPDSRACHASTAIGPVIYIFGGRYPSESAAHPLRENGTVHAFNTETGTWETLRPHRTKCADGVPKARIYASMSSSEHPRPGVGEARVGGHGTLFLHGGRNYHGRVMRDCWAFDVAGRTWSQWPSVPDVVGEGEVEGEGRVACTGGRLYRVGDGWGRVEWLELVREDIDDFSGKGEWGIGLKSGVWEREVEGTMERLEVKEVGEPSKLPLTKVEDMPVPRRGYGMLPITTGAGREYLLMLLGEDGKGEMLRDVWSFQIKSEKKTPAVLKDSIRSALGRQSGENAWARANVVESTKDEGPVEVPGGLSRFAIDGWRDLGAGGIVMFGGKNAKGDILGDGWLLVVE
jgi:hypothetical protein